MAAQFSLLLLGLLLYFLLSSSCAGQFYCSTFFFVRRTVLLLYFLLRPQDSSTALLSTFYFVRRTVLLLYFLLRERWMSFQFEKLLVYQKAIDFADEVCSSTEQISRGYGFLVDQLNRAALSISANSTISRAVICRT